MAYAKKARRSSKSKRRSPKKSRRPKAKAGRSSANKDVFKIRFESNMELYPQQGLFPANYMYSSFSMLNNTSGVISLPGNGEFGVYRQMYDQFRVHNVKVTFTPKYKAPDGLAGPVAVDSGVVAVGTNFVYSVVDRDAGFPSQIPAILRYSSHKVHTKFQKITRVLTATYPKDLWIDAQNIPITQAAIGLMGLRGCLGIYGEGFPELAGEIFNSSWYSAKITWDVTFRGKAINATVNETTGAVTLTQPVPADIKAFSPVNGLQNYTSLAPLYDIELGVDI